MHLIVQYITMRCNFCLSPAGDHLMSEIKTVGPISFSLVSVIIRHVHIHINALSFSNLAKLILPLRSLCLLSSCSAFSSMQICWCIPGACSSHQLGHPAAQRAAVPCHELSPSPEPLLLVVLTLKLLERVQQCSPTETSAALSFQCILVPYSALSLPGVQDLTHIKATQELLFPLTTGL